MYVCMTKNEAFIQLIMIEKFIGTLNAEYYVTQLIFSINKTETYVFIYTRERDSEPVWD